MYIDPDGHRALKEGSKGSDVKTLQKELQEAGYKIAADGVFGAKTEAALKDYQKKNGLAADGIAGDKTKASMGLPTDKSTSSNASVKSNPVTSNGSGTNTLSKPSTPVASTPSAPAAPQTQQPGSQYKSTTDAGKNSTTQGTSSKMTWPTESQTITSDFGYRNNPKITEEKTAKVEFHAGIDIGAVTRKVDGDEVYAAVDGTVVSVVLNHKSGGNMITIESSIDSDKIKVKYMHLQKNSIVVEKGDKVEEGVVIANMGSTGRSTGTHLHFQVEVYNAETKKWVPVDPKKYLK